MENSWNYEWLRSVRKMVLWIFEFFLVRVRDRNDLMVWYSVESSDIEPSIARNVFCSWTTGLVIIGRAIKWEEVIRDEWQNCLQLHAPAKQNGGRKLTTLSKMLEIRGNEKIITKAIFHFLWHRHEMYDSLPFPINWNTQIFTHVWNHNPKEDARY